MYNSDLRNKKKRQNIMIITSVAISLIITIFALKSFSDNINSQLNQAVEQDLENLAHQQLSSLNREFEAQQEQVRSIARALTVIDYDVNAVLEYMELERRSLPFEIVMVADLEGVGRLSTGEWIDVSDNTNFQTSLKGEMLTSAPHMSKYINKEVMTISAPIIVDGLVRGVVLAEYPLNYIYSQMSNIVDSEGYVLLTDQKGQVILTTNQDYVKIEELDGKTIEDGSYENLMYNLEKKIDGRIEFNYDNLLRVAEYRHLDINDWVVVFVANVEKMTLGMRSTTNFMLIIIISIILLAIIITYYILKLQKKNLDEVERAAYYDELTGLPNLQKFKIDAVQVMKDNPNLDFAIAKVDVMNFKAINETLGFEVGNEVLKALAELGRTVDEPTFIQARTGSDEMILFAGGALIKELHNTRYMFENRFRSLLKVAENHNFEFRYGRYIIEEGNTDITDIVNKAIIAHSYAKASGSGNFWDYDNKFKESILKTTAITNTMHKALENGEFKVYLQPKYRVSDKTPIGAEALVRWFREDGSIVYPNDFIPVLENNGFIIELDKYMLESMCKRAKYRLEQGKSFIPIAINFSRLHLDNPNFISEIIEITDKYGVPRSLIEIEITETAVAKDSVSIDKILDELHEAGFLLSIDDFGSGYSSLGMLKDVKVDTLKLDRSFLVDNNDSVRGNIIMEDFIKMAHRLEMNIVAEGVEHKEHAELLRTLGCDSAQGYFYARPMPIDEFEKLVFVD